MPSVPSSPFFDPTGPSYAVGTVRRKGSTIRVVSAARDGEIFRRPVCTQPQGIGRVPFSLKQQRCPHCGCSETLNCHSKLYGNDPLAAEGCCLRGQRVWCSNRGRRGGCGRSFCVFLADVLPRHTFRASGLWSWLIGLRAGLSLKAAAEKLSLSFALETFYQLRRKLRCALDRLRTRLCREQKAPPSTHTDPLLQTAAHLESVFPGSLCPPADFQLHFQHPFLG